LRLWKIIFLIRRGVNLFNFVYSCWIERGERVVIWHSQIKEKDINDMVLAGRDVQRVVECSNYSGLEAKLKFNTWKKI
jgi:hypothetical protein